MSLKECPTPQKVENPPTLDKTSKRHGLIMTEKKFKKEDKEVPCICLVLGKEEKARSRDSPTGTSLQKISNIIPEEGFRPMRKISTA